MRDEVRRSGANYTSKAGADQIAQPCAKARGNAEAQMEGGSLKTLCRLTSDDVTCSKQRLGSDAALRRGDCAGGATASMLDREICFCSMGITGRCSNCCARLRLLNGRELLTYDLSRVGRAMKAALRRQQG
eukprot:5704613-Pleurochrysis_carterae.AAC.1